MFMAGIGFTLSVGERADHLESIPQMQLEIAENQEALRAVEREVIVGTAERRQILCLVRLTATGDSYTPLQVQEICP